MRFLKKTSKKRDRRWLLIVFILTPLVRGLGQAPTDSATKLYHLYQASTPPGKTQPIPSDSGTFLVRFRPDRQPVGYTLLKQLPNRYAIIRWNHPSKPFPDFLEQTPANALWKASDRLAAHWLALPASATVTVQVAIGPSSVKLNEWLKNNVSGVDTKLTSYPIIRIPKNKLPELLAQPDILFAEEVRVPFEETALNTWDEGLIQVNQARTHYPTLTGKGIKVALKERRYNATDLDLLNRTDSSGLEAAILTSHATLMATTLGGNGNSFLTGRGVAPEVTFTSIDFSSLLPDELRYLTGRGISLENHSYGVGIENYYGIEAMEYDRQLNEADSLVHVFSSGNSGTDAPTEGTYAGLASWANLTGTFKQAKNVLVVGGIGSHGQPEDRSSRGPAYDGRVKPDLVAAGEEGTSGAAAAVSGIVALLQQSFRQKTGHIPPSALVKALLIGSSDDLATPHVDFVTGYGKANAYQALRMAEEGRYQQDSLKQGEIRTFPVIVQTPSSELKITLAWNDPASVLQAPVALVNDLNLRVRDGHGKEYLPWVLNAAPTADQLAQAAVRGIDSLNPVEQVTVSLPDAGTYEIEVEGRRVGGTQAFALSYQTRANGVFEWETPAMNEQLFAGTTQVLRWHSTLDASLGQLSLSTDEGRSWELLSDSVSLAAGYYSWETPPLFTRARLKMQINGRELISDPFSLSQPLSLQVGYICSEELLLHWQLQPNSIGYRLYALQHGLLSPYRTVTDTLIRLPSEAASFGYFAVSALGPQELEGIRSLTIDLHQQGVGCYVRSLLAEAQAPSVRLQLDLGTTEGLTNIRWQRLDNGVFTDIETTKVTQHNTRYEWNDTPPRGGLLFYRVVLTTESGQLVETDRVRTVLLSTDRFLILPNPAGEQITIFSGALDAYELQLSDALGRTVLSSPINSLEQPVPVATLRPGLYLCRIFNQGVPVFQGKIIKQ